MFDNYYPLTPVPADLLEKIKSPKPAHLPIVSLISTGQVVTLGEGKRNDRLFHVGIGMRYKGMHPDVIRTTLHETNRCQCNPCLPPEEVDAIVDSVLKYSIVPHEHFNATDIGNTDKFVEAQGGTAKFCHTRKRWFFYNGKYYVEDFTGAITRQIVEWLKAQDALPPPEGDDDCEAIKQYRKHKKHIKESQKRARIEAIEFIARSHPECAMSSGMWDSNAALINMRNGTFNRETGILQPHSKSDSITVFMDVVFPASQTLFFLPAIR